MARTHKVQKQEEHPVLQFHRQRLRVPHDVDYNLYQNRMPSAGWHIGEVWVFSNEMSFFSIIDSKAKKSNYILQDT
jgi:hypothetical protein